MVLSRGRGGGGMRGGIGRAAGPRRMGGMRRGGMRMGPSRGWRGSRGNWGGGGRRWRYPHRRLRYGPRIWWGGYPYLGSSYYWDPYCTVWDANNPYCDSSGLGVSFSL